MITLQSADSVLKSFYLDAISESLNYKANPFFAKLERTANDVVGKDVRKVIRNGFNAGVGAGTETGDLPSARASEYKTFVAPLKNIYGTIEISDKALRASANNEGAFVNILNDEMKALEKSAAFNFSRMLFGDGTGVLSTVKSVMSGLIAVSAPENFVAGMVVTFEGLDEFACCKIKEVNRLAGEIVLEKTGWEDAAIPTGTVVRLYGSSGEEMTGLKAIFSNNAIYGVARNVIGMEPYFTTSSSINQTVIQNAIDNVEERSGCKVDFILCSWGVRRALIEYYNTLGTTLPTIQLEGGYTALNFNGIPIVTDRFCPKGTMYLLTSENFKIHQLCDWQWLEAEDGKILKQVSGKPVYQATLVKYAELICENPSAQGRISGINEK
ncbi:MAG: phage major capsid protein [Clostridia bacterium]|nr:phage major capsid protein [Clostridia bacterium]MBQ8446223.1 phage major capsid protein [Clostridia bacterium]MBQ8447012.1 phage major capsid protein [Clostridia bacterium]